MRNGSENESYRLCDTVSLQFLGLIWDFFFVLEIDGEYATEAALLAPVYRN